MNTTTTSTSWIGYMVVLILIAILLLGILLGGSELLNPQATQVKIDATQKKIEREQQLYDQQLANLQEEHDAKMDLLQKTIPQREGAISLAIQIMAVGAGLGITILLTCIGLALGIRLTRVSPGAPPIASHASKPPRPAEFG